MNSVKGEFGQEGSFLTNGLKSTRKGVVTVCSISVSRSMASQTSVPD